MPGIWTLPGNSSTARSGWVAADATQQPCRVCSSESCELSSAQKNARLSVSRDFDLRQNVPEPIGQEFPGRRADQPPGTAVLAAGPTAGIGGIAPRISWFIVQPLIRVLSSDSRAVSEYLCATSGLLERAATGPGCPGVVAAWA